MAEAVVEDRPRTRFYCHMCDVEFQTTSSNFICPHCSNGFIEQLEDNGSGGGSQSRPTDLDFTLWQDADENDVHLGTGGGPNEGRPVNRVAPTIRQQLPFEHLVQDFIINLGVGVNTLGVNWGAPGNVQLFLGNPGDYAWGREGLDAIVTQLLNQMDSTGPPPVSKAVIDALEIVEVTEDQVNHNLQCSVCWENFQLKEQVRQLPCLHIYHEQCIRPWLELHGTCPICRQNLGGEGEGGQGNIEHNEGGSGTRQDSDLVYNSPNLVHDALRSLFNSTRGGGGATSSNSQQTDQSVPNRPRSNSDSMM